MLDINATKPNLVGSTSNTIHMAVNTFERNRYACRPNTKLVAALVESCRTDSPVTCGNCLKVVKRAHVLADRMMDAIDSPAKRAYLVDSLSVPAWGITRATARSAAP